VQAFQQFPYPTPPLARPKGAQARLLAEINEHEQQHKQELLLAEYRNYQQGVMPASGTGARDLVEFFTSDDAQLPATLSAPTEWGSDQEVRSLLSARARTLHLSTANAPTRPSSPACHAPTRASAPAWRSWSPGRNVSSPRSTTPPTVVRQLPASPDRPPGG
jgi:hypothetical protein